MITSPGEALWYSLHNHFIAPRYLVHPLDYHETSWADPIGRLRKHNDDTIVSASCTRLISKARNHLDHLVPGGGPLNEVPYRESTMKVIKQFCVDPMGMSFMDRALEKFALLAFDAAVAANATISGANRQATCRDAAKRNGGYILCYVCATNLGRWDTVRREKNLALDHLWPRSFGGISTEENLLPICDDCNGLKKDRITWDVYGTVQDYALSRNSTNGLELTKIALHRRAATKLAEDELISLKDAFILLGPVQDLLESQPDEPFWFFNQTAHDSTKLKELW
jgi:hypothetical protein